jgi:hypothetical protein
MFVVSFWVSGNLPALYSRAQSESIQPVALIVLSCENQRESPLKCLIPFHGTSLDKNLITGFI